MKINTKAADAFRLVKELMTEVKVLKQLLAAQGIDEAAIQTAIRRMNNDR